MTPGGPAAVGPAQAPEDTSPNTEPHRHSARRMPTGPGGPSGQGAPRPTHRPHTAGLTPHTHVSSYTLTLTHILSHTHVHSHPLSYTYTHTHTLILIHAHTHSRPHTHTPLVTVTSDNSCSETCTGTSVSRGNPGLILPPHRTRCVRKAGATKPALLGGEGGPGRVPRSPSHQSGLAGSRKGVPSSTSLANTDLGGTRRRPERSLLDRVHGHHGPERWLRLRRRGPGPRSAKGPQPFSSTRPPPPRPLHALGTLFPHQPGQRQGIFSNMLESHEAGG